MSDFIDFRLIADRLPPQNVEAEESILGGILIDPDAISRVADIICSDAFSLEIHRMLYRATHSLWTQGQPTDLLTVTAWLADRDQLEKVGGQSKLVQLIDRTVSAVNIDRYAKLVMDKYLRRRLIHAGHEIVNIGYDSTLSLEESIERSEERIFNLAHKDKRETGYHLSDALANAFDNLEKRGRGELKGIPTGLYDLDEMTGGLQRSDLVIVGGRSSMGKTAYSIKIALEVARQDIPVLFFSLEMSKEQLAERMFSIEAKIDSQKMRTGKLEPGDWDAISKACGKLVDFPLYVIDDASANINSIISLARKYHAQEQNRGGLGIVLIDYVQLIDVNGGSGNRAIDLGQVSRGLKKLARELNVCVVGLSQLSRAVESRNNHRPTMSDLRESGNLEQDADLIVMLYRDEYYNPGTPDRGIAEVIIAKQRNGPVGTVKLLYDSKYTEFKNIARSY